MATRARLWLPDLLDVGNRSHGERCKEGVGCRLARRWKRDDVWRMAGSISTYGLTLLSRARWMGNVRRPRNNVMKIRTVSMKDPEVIADCIPFMDSFLPFMEYQKLM